MRTTPTAFHPSLKITASCVGVAPSELGLAFARKVAAYVIYWKDRGSWGWGVDQVGLFSCYAQMTDEGREPRTLFLDDFAMNDKVGDTGMIRFMSGMDKYIAGSPA